MTPTQPGAGPAAADTVIVAFGSRNLLTACIAAAKPLGGEIVVVDHGGDGSSEVARALGATVVSDSANPGFGAGQNRGVHLTQSPFVLLLNPDAVINPGAVRRGLDYLADHPEVAAVQGVIRSREGGVDRSQGRELAPVHLWGRALGLRRLLVPLGPVLRRVGGLSDHVDRRPVEATAVQYLAATALLIRRTAFEQISGFDPEYFLYGEDLDLCVRLRGAGWSLVALPEDWALHGGGESSANWAVREISWWQGTLRYSARWWTQLNWISAWLAGLIMVARIVMRSPRTYRVAVRDVLVSPVAARRDLAHRVGTSQSAVGDTSRSKRHS